MPGKGSTMLKGGQSMACLGLGRAVKARDGHAMKCGNVRGCCSAAGLAKATHVKLGAFPLVQRVKLTSAVRKNTQERCLPR